MLFNITFTYFRVDSDYSLKMFLSALGMIPIYFVSLPFILECMVATLHCLLAQDDSSQYAPIKQYVVILKCYFEI